MIKRKLFGLMSISFLLAGCGTTSQHGWLRNRDFDYLHQNVRHVSTPKMPEGMPSPAYKPALQLGHVSEDYVPKKTAVLTPPKYDKTIPVPTLKPKPKADHATKKKTESAAVSKQVSLSFTPSGAGLLTIMADKADAWPKLDKSIKASGYVIASQDRDNGTFEIKPKVGNGSIHLFVNEEDKITHVSVFDAKGQISESNTSVSLLKQLKANYK